jgi:transposase-like protein
MPYNKGINNRKGTMNGKLVTVGEYCPNKECEDYGELQIGNIRKYGKTKGNKQRYQCKTCQVTFTETKGTLFYRRRTAEKDIIEVLAMLAEGMRISSITRVKGFKEDTILDWLREAAQHAEEVEAILLNAYQISQAQIDGMWAYVGHKGEKGGIAKRRNAANSGDVR